MLDSLLRLRRFFFLMFAIDTKRLSSSMQAFNLSLTNVSVNSP